MSDKDSYKDKIEIVSKILSLDVVVETKDKNFVMSVGSEQVLAKNKLPYLANFVRGFKARMEELKAEEGCWDKHGLDPFVVNLL